MQTAKYVLIRIAFGALISGLGFLVAILVNNRNLYYSWFSMGGLLLIAIGALFFLNGSKNGDLAEQSFAGTSINEIRKRNSGSSLKVTLIIIGAVNLVLPLVLYFTLH